MHGVQREGGQTGHGLCEGHRGARVPGQPQGQGWVPPGNCSRIVKKKNTSIVVYASRMKQLKGTSSWGWRLGVEF